MAVLCALLIVAFVGMFAMMLLAIQTSKELSASHGQLTDTSGHRISTGTARDGVDGVLMSSTRRLSGNSSDHVDYEVPPGVFEKAKERMGQGSAVVVVKMPDDHYYTAQIGGVVDNFAWGQYFDESTERSWSVSCPVVGSGSSPTMCSIATHAQPRELRERAGLEFNDANDLDRALWGRREK